MISAALTLLCVRRKSPVTYSAAVEFMRCWFLGLDSGERLPKPVADAVERAKRESNKPACSPQLLGALDHVELWRRLDSRTKSNLQSCLLNVLRPLVCVAASRCFDSNDRVEFSPAEVAEGRLCVVCVNALIHPELAKFVLRLARRQLFDAVQARQQGPNKLCGLLADELPLILQPEDADQISTLRSRSCFILAATQGLAPIDDKIGPRLRRSVLLNFNSIVFLRTRELETGEFATMSLGQVEQRIESKPTETWEESMTKLWSQIRSGRQPTWVCPPGALGNLGQHQGYVVGADGSRTERPVWFVPWFDLAPATASACEHQGCAARYIESLMSRCGFKIVLPSELVRAAVKLDEHRRDRAMDQAIAFFLSKACLIPKGLDLLPACWLAALPGILWATRKPNWTHLPYMLSRVDYEGGVLLLNFAQEQAADDDQLTLWDELRVVVNRNLYPSRWRGLKRRHRMLLLFARPDLRTSLEASPIAAI
jgi:hypothetical protein